MEDAPPTVWSEMVSSGSIYFRSEPQREAFLTFCTLKHAQQNSFAESFFLCFPVCNGEDHFQGLLRLQHKCNTKLKTKPQAAFS